MEYGRKRIGGMKIRNNHVFCRLIPSRPTMIALLLSVVGERNGKKKVVRTYTRSQLLIGQPNTARNPPVTFQDPT